MKHFTTVMDDMGENKMVRYMLSGSERMHSAILLLPERCKVSRSILERCIKL